MSKSQTKKLKIYYDNYKQIKNMLLENEVEFYDGGSMRFFYAFNRKKELSYLSDIKKYFESLGMPIDSNHAINFSIRNDLNFAFTLIKHFKKFFVPMWYEDKNTWLGLRMNKKSQSSEYTIKIDKKEFSYNTIKIDKKQGLLIVDNYSTDLTGQIIKRYLLYFLNCQGAKEEFKDFIYLFQNK